MVGKIAQFFSVMLFIATLMFGGSSSAKAAQNISANPGLIEVFTSTDLPVTGEGDKASISKFSKVNLQIFELDGIQQIEGRLSQGLLQTGNRHHPWRHHRRPPRGRDDLGDHDCDGGRHGPGRVFRRHPPLPDTGRGYSQSGRRVQPDEVDSDGR